MPPPASLYHRPPRTFPTMRLHVIITRGIILVLSMFTRTLVHSYDMEINTLELRFFECEDPRNNLRKLEHPESCDKIVQCIGNHPMELKCPRIDQAFNQDLQVCVQKFSPEDTCTVKNADRECRLINVRDKAKQHLFIPHMTTCHRYYNCSNDGYHHRFSPFQIHEMECPYPEYWDVKKKACLHYSEVECGDRFAPRWVCDYLSFSCDGPNCRPCYIHHPSCIGREDGEWPNPIFNWSPYYVECRGERPTSTEQKKCPLETISKTEQIFHPTSRKCVPLWLVPKEFGGLEPSCEDAPPGYYQLVELDVITYACPGVMMFYCELPYPGHRNIHKCKMMLEKSRPCEDGHWPLFTHLWSDRYLWCSNGKFFNMPLWCTLNMGFPQLFHPLLRLCLSPWYIPWDKGGAKPTCEGIEPGEYDVPKYPGIMYRCPGLLFLNCTDLRVKDTSGFSWSLAFFQVFPENRIVYATNKDGDYSCDYIVDPSIDATNQCDPSNTGTSYIAVQEHMWTPHYATCETRTGENADGTLRLTVKAHHKFCLVRNRTERVFDPSILNCVNRWQLSPENGGYVARCNCKSTGQYSIGSFMYTCPQEEISLCYPPMFSTFQTPECKPIPLDISTSTSTDDDTDTKGRLLT